MITVIAFVCSLLLVVSADDDTFCSAPHENGVYCAREKDSTAAQDLLVFCLNGKPARVTRCESLCINSKDGVEPAYCRVNSLWSVNGRIRSEKEDTWLVQSGTGPPMQSGEEPSEPLAAACDGTSLTAISEPLGFGDHSKNLIFEGFSMPLGQAQVLGIIVKLVARAQHESSAPDAPMQHCYTKDIELKSGKTISANRAIEAGSFNDEGWAVLKFGHKHDTWDTFDKPGLLTSAAFNVEIDVEAMSGDDDYADVVCAVDCLNITVFYADPLSLLPGASSTAGDSRHPAIEQFIEWGPQGTKWRWLYPSMAPWDEDDSLSWRLPAYDDEAWSGPDAPPLGFDTKDHSRAHPLSTKLPVDKNADEHPVTAYFRTRFTLEKPPSCYRRLQITAKIDDSAIVYLNGQPIWWYNMDLLPPSDWQSLAWLASSGVDVSAVVADSVLLLPGENVVAVEVHQVSSSSHDMYFNLGLGAWDVCGGDDQPADEAEELVDPQLLLNCVEGTHRCRCGPGKTCDTVGSQQLVCSGANFCVDPSVLPQQVPGAGSKSQPQGQCSLGTIRCGCSAGFACASGLDCQAGICLPRKTSTHSSSVSTGDAQSPAPSSSDRTTVVFIIFLFLLALALGLGVWYRSRRKKAAGSGYKTWSNAQGEQVQMFGDGGGDDEEAQRNEHDQIQLVED